jgi:hypothetical protein
MPEGHSQPDNQEREVPQPLFPLGQIVGTPGAMEAMQEAQQNPLQLLFRHVTGDWGDLGEEDKAENDFSVQRGFRILSAYTLATEVKIWLITEADRSVTTFLLPEEY